MPFINLKPIKNGDAATPALFNERFDKIASTINGGFDSANIADGAITAEKIAAAAVSADKMSPAADWQAVTYQNNWVTYDTTWGAAQYYKDHAGVVHFRGLIKNGTVGQTAFTLPAGYRPSVRLLFATQSDAGTSRIDVTPDGQVIVVAGGTGWQSLAPIVYRAEQ